MRSKRVGRTVEGARRWRKGRRRAKSEELLGFEPRLQGGLKRIKTLRPKPLDDSSDACHASRSSISIPCLTVGRLSAHPPGIRKKLDQACVRAPGQKGNDRTQV